MSKCYWITAIVFGLLLLAGSGQTQEETYNSQSQASQKQGPSQSPQLPFPVIVVEDEASTKARQRSEQEAAQRDVDDLAAQQGMNAATQAMNEATQRMALYSLISTILVGVGTALLMFTLYLTRQANEAAREAVEVTREMGMKQVRAYVFHETITIKWEGASIEHIVFIWKNSGLSPAKNVIVNSYLSIVRPPIWVDGMSEANLDDIETGNQANGVILASVSQGSLPPGGDLKTMTAKIAAGDVAEWRRGECAILAHGTVTYIDEFNQRRYSRCCYRLVYEDTPSRHVTHFERLTIGNSYK